MLKEKYKHHHYRYRDLFGAYFRRICIMLRLGKYDCVWIEKEALPWFPVFLETWLLRKSIYVLDYDDAVFHTYDLHSSCLVRILFGRRLDLLMSRAAAVVCGNSYLAARAWQASASCVQIIPTSIDLKKYNQHISGQSTRYLSESLCRLVWIGSPATVHYLQLIAPILITLNQRKQFILRVIGATFDVDGIAVENITWSEATEVQAISECDIGIMPLADSPWELGKCGYKLIQYMGCSLPVVATGVGANCDIVAHGQSGFLVNTSDEWLAALEKLLSSNAARIEMGAAGRKIVEQRYSLQVNAQYLINIFRAVTAKG